MGDARSNVELSRIVDGLLGRNCSETPNSSPNETCEATAAFYKALTNAQIPRAAAAASYFTQGDKLFCVRVSCVDAAESEPAPAPSPPAGASQNWRTGSNSRRRRRPSRFS